MLEHSGLGRKIVTFPANHGGHAHLEEHLVLAYPPLGSAGGFTLARSDRSRQLDKIPIPASGYTIEYLRHGSQLKKAPVYIIPLQQHLQVVGPAVEEVSVLASLGHGVLVCLVLA